MTARMMMSDLDARRLLKIVSDDRPYLPAEGLPLPLLGDLAGLIGCDYLSFFALDGARQAGGIHAGRPGGRRRGRRGG